MKNVLSSLFLFVLMLASPLALTADELTEGQAVGVLKSKDHLLELYTSEDGPLYTVKTKKGELLASLLSGEQIRSQFPELHHLVEGVADGAVLGPQQMEAIQNKDSPFTP